MLEFGGCHNGGTMDATQTRRLGRTALEVTALGFGGAVVGNLYTNVAEDQALETVETAYSEGLRFFDTAPFYGHGLSEHRIGDVLRRYPRESFVLSTKVGRLLRPETKVAVDPGVFSSVLPFEPIFDYSFDGAIRSVEDSLQRLGLNRIDVVLIHDVDVFTHGVDQVDERFQEAMEGAYRALERLRTEGTVGAIGCGLNEWEACYRCAQAGDFDCFLLAGRYSLLQQESLDPFLKLCEQRGIGIIIGGPYNSGILVTGPLENATYDYSPATPEILELTSRIQEVCDRHQVPLAAAALQFPLGHPAVSTVIPGARTAAEVRENMRLLDLQIPEDLWLELKHQDLIRKDSPIP